MILEAPSEHKLVDKQPMIVLTAIPNQLDQIGMPELPQKVYLRLQIQKPINKVSKRKRKNKKSKEASKKRKKKEEKRKMHKLTSHSL